MTTAVRILIRKLPSLHGTRRWLAVFALASVGTMACAPDCSREMQMGDFEMQQGNLERAKLHYERAGKVDPACPGLDGRLERLEQRERFRQAPATMPSPDTIPSDGSVQSTEP